MQIELEEIHPSKIEERSFEIIEQEIGAIHIPELQKPIVKRVIHTTADFDCLDNLFFSSGVVEQGIAALKRGACIVTDTNMVKSGIHKSSLARLGGEVFCYMDDDEVAREAAERGCTRSAICMERAAREERELLFAIGNAPTALVRVCELLQEGRLQPELVIGVPVGFVNVVQAKEMLLSCDVPHIVAKGRKGGSNVAAAICNALIYMATGERRSMGGHIERKV